MPDCDILRKYDLDGDGKISLDDFLKAYDDWVAGKITKDQFLAVYDAWVMGTDINQICPPPVVEIVKVEPEKRQYTIDDRVIYITVYFRSTYGRDVEVDVNQYVNGKLVGHVTYTVPPGDSSVRDHWFIFDYPFNNTPGTYKICYEIASVKV
jgi:hypothetical protein